jgi:two-component system sensor histidine kinase CpxA
MTAAQPHHVHNLIPQALKAFVTLLLFIALPATGQAVPDPPERVPRNPPFNQLLGPPPRNPPRIAIEVCEGKYERDACTFPSPRGVVNGFCLSGSERLLACRPHRDQNGEVIQTIQPEQNQHNESGGTVQTETKPVHVSVQEPLKESVKNRMPPAEVPQNSPEKVPQVPQIQTASQQPDNPPEPLQPPHPPPHELINFIDFLGRNSGGFGSFLLVAITASGLTWYGFFRYSTLPLRRLRKVTQQLAGGDLTARVGEGLVHRKDEVADLGRDVDRMAERIESLVTAHQRLIRDVSHELRSPLARLNVALELARQSAGPAHNAPFDRIERESDRLNELIGQLLMLTKLESESGSIKRGEFDIAALVIEIATDADFEARNNNRQVVATVSEKVLLNGNSELLRQAIENLVRNAVRYTDQGTSVEISIKKKAASGRNWVHIEVRDHGPGVPESALYDIFRPFYRVNDARERQSGGTGVGLAISDRAVRLHGGSLRAFNAPGGGLVMEMELPLL